MGSRCLGGEAVRKSRSAGSVGLVAYGPIGREEMGSHGYNPSENPQTYPWRKGRAIAQLECWRERHFEPQNGSAHTDRYA